MALGLSSCGPQAPERRLSSCGARAQLLCGMWDPPGPGPEPVSPALAGGLPTTAPPGKPYVSSYFLLIVYLFSETLFNISSCLFNYSFQSETLPLEVTIILTWIGLICFAFYINGVIHYVFFCFCLCYSIFFPQDSLILLYVVVVIFHFSRALLYGYKTYFHSNIDENLLFPAFSYYA